MSPSYLFIVFIALCAFTHVLGDLYMQNPRGNNDRLNEATDRDNANRLFDSQNNAQGGYCWGPELTYVEGSQLSIEWTNQHSCGVENTDCNMIIQYMCTSDAPGADATQIIRDGTTTNTITTVTTTTANNYYNVKNADGTFTYGMNEPISNYQSCVARTRNQGLYTANQNVANNQGSMATRQNPTGTRYGFECTEENDYYPYWHPSPWTDIAVLTNNATPDQCAFYQAQSENVLGKNYCSGTTAAAQAANNEADCAKAAGQWLVSTPKGVPAPDCQAAPSSRDNHLGNGIDGNTLAYNWTLPTQEAEDCIANGNCTCVLRLRYNITLGELNGTEDASVSGKKSALTNDPTVSADGTLVTLALDTAQTGRTFQDRSYMFRIKPRTPDLANVNIYNVNVRGKRGNIVQTYPATEYDFVPTNLEVKQGDAVTFQWTGCDTNPAGNAGQGTDQTDRSNLVQIDDSSKNYPLKFNATDDPRRMFADPAQTARFANIDQTNCLNAQQLAKAAAAANGVAVDQNKQNCYLLNQAKQRFSGATVVMNNVGDYYYMSTRNNNFSNRSQKGSLKVLGPNGSPIINLSPAQTSGVVVGVVAAVAVGALVGTIVYAKRNPHSGAGAVVSKIPGLNRIM